ncbi:DUF5712 family protein [Nafulsella turpanensis]|uniref:DUF5712 family protein n=1 Tax=Nafulsella turpanensis TaxID=1265690 RepID=UPI0003616245|nr:DUF5712 family protein [Nafulsella turpanensis]
MHSKIIHPLSHGKAVYANKGSCARLVSYLQHEAREKGEGLSFFNEEGEGLRPEEVQHRIDYNVKGLRKTESKFIALVLSPSPAELRHISSRAEKLKQFTIQAMQNYAANFQLKNGKRLAAKDLLWYAAIHHHRTFKGTEAAVKEGLVRSGEQKPGLQMHVHIIVSKRDRSQQITLSPFGNRERFNMKVWQKNNQQSFCRMFDYPLLQKEAVASRKSPDAAKQDRLHFRIKCKVAAVNQYLDKVHQLRPEKVLEIAEKRAYHKTFFLNLYRLEHKLKSGQFVRDPLHLLEHNRDRKWSREQPENSLVASVRQLAEAHRKMGFTEYLSLSDYPFMKGRKRRKQKDKGQE